MTRKAGEEDATFWESVGQGRFDISDAQPRRTAAPPSPCTSSRWTRRRACRTSPTPCARSASSSATRTSSPTRSSAKMERTEYERDDEGKIKADAEPKKVVEDRTLNAMKPIWTRPQSEVTDEEYAEFYRHVAHDWTEPLKTVCPKAEGRLEYRALLFVPAKAPLDFGLGGTDLGPAALCQAGDDHGELRGAAAALPALRARAWWTRPTCPSTSPARRCSRIATSPRSASGSPSRILKTLDEMKNEEREKYLKFWSAVRPDPQGGRHRRGRVPGAAAAASSSSSPRPTTTS